MPEPKVITLTSNEVQTALDYWLLHIGKVGPGQDTEYEFVPYPTGEGLRSVIVTVGNMSDEELLQAFERLLVEISDDMQDYVDLDHCIDVSIGASRDDMIVSLRRFASLATID